jgi:acyl-CoA dehydrogenase family protein 9
MSSSAPPTAPPSFTRGLFQGEIHHELLFPYPASLEVRDPTEATLVRRIIADLRRLERDLIDPAANDANATVPEEVIRAFGEIGMLALTIPTEYGGLGLSAAGYGRVFAAVCTIDPSLGVLVGVHCGLGAKTIVLFGNEAQKRAYLPRLATGEILGAYALTEPDVGSDAQHIKATATRAPDGAGWLLNGRKIWIGNGHRAGVIATFAQTEFLRDGKPVTRPTAFLLRPDAPGFRVERTFEKMGIRGSTQAELVYTDLYIPDDHVLHEVGKGFHVAVRVLNAGRHTLAAGCTGGAKKLLGELTTYATQRVQFGKPIAEFEITERKIATLAADIYAADAMVGVLSQLMDDPDADPSLEAACGKVFASDLIWRTADELVQVAGGRGFCKPWPYERYLRDARINRIFEGANEVLRLFIALTGLQGPGEDLKELGDALKAPLGNLGVLGEFAVGRIRRRVDLAVEFHDALKGHERFFERHVAEFAKACQDAVIRHRTAIIERQLVLERLANMAIELYARAAVLSRTQALIERQGIAGSAREVSLCGLFCVESGRRFRGQRNALDGGEDEIDEHRRGIARAVRGAGGWWVPDPVLEEGH